MGNTSCNGTSSDLCIPVSKDGRLNGRRGPLNCAIGNDGIRHNALLSGAYTVPPGCLPFSHWWAPPSDLTPLPQGQQWVGWLEVVGQKLKMGNTNLLWQSCDSDDSVAMFRCLQEMR